MIDESHLVCCDPDRAICGLDLTGGDDVDDDPALAVCKACSHKDRTRQTCGARWCRIREWWRGWWS